MMIIRKTVFTILILSVSFLFAGNVLSFDYLNGARQHLEKGEYRAAIIQLKNQLKNKPKDTQARYLLGVTYLKTEQIASAEKELQKAYTLNPDSPEIALAYAELLVFTRDYAKVEKILVSEFTDIKAEQQRQLYRAKAYLGLGQLADARQIFNKIAEESANTQAYIGLAKLALVEKETNTASQWLDKALVIEEDNKDALYLKAKLANSNKKYADSLAIYTILIKQNPDNLAYYNERATVYLMLKQYKEAEQDINKVLAKVKKQPQANYMRSIIKLQQLKYKEAQIAAQNVLNAVPQHYPSMLILGITNLSLGYFNQAEKYLLQYISAHPDNIEAQRLLADVYLSSGNPDGALLLLEAMDEDKIIQNPRVLMTLGSAHLMQGEIEKGIRILNQAQELDPENSQIQQKLIAGNLKAGDMDNSIAGLEKIVNSGKSNKRAKYLLIVSYIQKKELQKAENLINDILQQNTDDPDLYNFSAVIEKLKGNNIKAKESYQKALQIKKDYSPAYLGLAQLAVENNELDKAKEYLNQIININNQSYLAYIVLAGIAEKQNNLQEAEKQLLAGLENTSDNLKVQIKMAVVLGKWYVKQKQAEKIIPLAQKLTSDHPQSKAVLSFEATAYIVNNKISDAEKTLYQIIDKDKSDIKNRLLLVKLLASQTGKKTEIINLLDEIIEITPDKPKPVALKADYLLKNKQYQKAMNVADYAQQQFPESALGQTLKGDIYLKEKNFPKAIDSYREAYAIQPNNTVLFVIVELLKKQSQDDIALKLLEDESQKDDTNVGIHFVLAQTYMQNKQTNKAVSHYQKILDINNKHILALNNLAWIYSQQNNPEAAILAKKAYEQAPDAAAIADTYGVILVKQGETANGINILEKAVQLNPEAHDIQYHLAEAYYLNRDKEKARVILEKIANSEKNFEEKDNAISLLKNM